MNIAVRPAPLRQVGNSVRMPFFQRRKARVIRPGVAAQEVHINANRVFIRWDSTIQSRLTERAFRNILRGSCCNRNYTNYVGAIAVSFANPPSQLAFWSSRDGPPQLPPPPSRRVRTSSSRPAFGLSLINTSVASYPRSPAAPPSMCNTYVPGGIKSNAKKPVLSDVVVYSAPVGGSCSLKFAPVIGTSTR